MSIVGRQKIPPSYVPGGERCRNPTHLYNHGIRLNAGVTVMSKFLDVGEQAAREGGRILLDRQGKVKPIKKGRKDFYTKADTDSQEAIIEVLSNAYPAHLTLAEEGNPIEADGDSQSVEPIGPDQYRWIIDPLDGTVNYVHGVPSFAVSVALERGGQLVVGVVYDPVLDECFTATAGEGAFLNRKRIGPSQCASMQDALAAVSFSADVPRGSVEISRFVEVLHACHTIRRMGSAALNLCYVACGRLDCYVASSVKVWDVAAGVLLLQEAGAAITSLDGGPFDLYRPKFACAATDQLHTEFMEILARAE